MTENLTYIKCGDCREEALSFITGMLKNNKIDPLGAFYQLENLAGLSMSQDDNKKDYSIITILLYNILKDSQAIYGTGSYVLCCELYHISITNIIRSYNPDKSNDSYRSDYSSSGSMDKSDYLLLSDGLISYIASKEYSDILSKLPSSFLVNALQSRQYAQKKIIDLDLLKLKRKLNAERERRLIFSFMLVKLIFYLSCMKKLSKEQIDLLHNFYCSMDMDFSKDEANIHNELYSELTKLGFI